MKREHPKEPNPLSWQSMLIIAAASLAISFMIGVGGYYTQSGDWVAKNPTLNDLVASPWPVIIYPKCMSAEIQTIIGSEPIAFVYYFFYFLPAACVGKLFGIEAARFALYLWTAAGLFLVMNAVMLFLPSKTFSKRGVCLMIFFFVFFGGLDLIGWGLHVAAARIQGVAIPHCPLGILPFLDTWCAPYFTYYASHWTSLWWCFNQCIPVWLITAVILLNGNLKSVVFWYSFTVLYSPWAAMGLFPIVLVYAIFSLAKDKKQLSVIFNVQNIVFPLFVLLVAGSFYMSNSHPLADKGWFWEFMSPLKFAVKYIAFILVELGVYCYAMRKELDKQPWLAISFVVLLLIPFYNMTRWNDFIMRASIPALFIVFMYWYRWCVNNFHSRSKLIVAVFCISSVTALRPMLGNIRQTFRDGKNVCFEDWDFCKIKNITLATLGEEQFFAHDYKTTFFWKYLAR